MTDYFPAFFPKDISLEDKTPRHFSGADTTRAASSGTEVQALKSKPKGCRVP